jgi:hypothetical protein
MAESAYTGIDVGCDCSGISFFGLKCFYYAKDIQAALQSIEPYIFSWISGAPLSTESFKYLREYAILLKSATSYSIPSSLLKELLLLLDKITSNFLVYPLSFDDYNTNLLEFIGYIFQFLVYLNNLEELMISKLYC